jgi:hypothetical protein
VKHVTNNKPTTGGGMSTVKINIKRSVGNVRFGSRAWAARQTNWTWHHGVSGDGIEHIYISCDGHKNLAVLTESYDTEAYSGKPQESSMNYGGTRIGAALWRDLCKFADENCSTSGDDEIKLIISKG